MGTRNKNHIANKTKLGREERCKGQTVESRTMKKYGIKTNYSLRIQFHLQQFSSFISCILCASCCKFLLLSSSSILSLVLYDKQKENTRNTKRNHLTRSNNNKNHVVCVDNLFQLSFIKNEHRRKRRILNKKERKTPVFFFSFLFNYFGTISII